MVQWIGDKVQITSDIAIHILRSLYAVTIAQA